MRMKSSIGLLGAAPLLAAGTFVLLLGSGTSPRENDGERDPWLNTKNPSPPRSATLVRCSAHVEGREPIGPPRQEDLVVGPMRFSALRKTGQMLGGRTGEGNRFVPIKAGVVVEAGSTVTVALPRSERDRVRFGAPRRGPDYGPRAVTFKACPHDQAAWNYNGPVGRWTGFVAGFLVRGPHCAPIEVWVEGREQPLRQLISFGEDSCAR